MNIRFACGLASVAGVLAFQSDANATFHLMQIEQVVASVNNDTTAQAIQLRMRSGFQNFVSQSKLVVVDAQGQNPIVLIDIGTDLPNGQTGDHVLIASATFPSKTMPAAVPDFFMTNLIPESYFAAGSLTFEQDNGLVYLRLSWGGSAYTGPTNGEITNDLDGQFGPPFPGGLTTCGAYPIRFQGTATDRSTSNDVDYKYEQDQVLAWVNNADTSFTLRGPKPQVRLQTIDATASEQPANDVGRFRVLRTGCTELALVVRYTMSGTATNGSDYQQLPGVVSVPVGSTNGMITVRAINDPAPEPNETAIATLAPNPNYTVANPNTGTVTIISNE